MPETISPLDQALWVLFSFFLSFSFILTVENETLVLEHPLDSLEREKGWEEQKVARIEANQSIEDEDHSGLYHAYYFFIELYCH